jgi:hypothetical protein
MSDQRVEFVRLEIRTGMTMLKIAHTERSMQDPEASSKAIKNAHKALDTAKEFLSKLKAISDGELDELRIGMEELEQAIDQYERDSS